MNSIEKPIFILGCTKSGTTLMRNLFDGHKDVFVIPLESHFFQNIMYWVSYYFRRTKPKNLDFYQMKRNLIDWIKYSNSIDNKVADGFTRSKWNTEILESTLMSNEVKSIDELSNLYVEAIYKSLYNQEYNNKLRFVEKSVENIELAMDWLKIYPNAKFINILRNPYSNIVAIRKYLSKNRNYPSLKPAVFSLYNSYYNMYKNKSLIDNYIIVKYEDIMSDTGGTMYKLCEFLDLDFDEGLLMPTLFGQNWQGNSTSGKKFTGVSKMNLDKWKKDITPIEIKMVNELFDFVLDDFHYEKYTTKKSLFSHNKREGIKNYILNRFLWYFMPRFK